MTLLAPCPFCASTNIDPEGWASLERKGPACDDCGATADTVERWNASDRMKGAASIVASIIGAVATYEEPAHWKGTVYEGCGKKAAAEVLERIRELRPMTQALAGNGEPAQERKDG